MDELRDRNRTRKNTEMMKCQCSWLFIEQTVTSICSDDYLDFVEEK